MADENNIVNEFSFVKTQTYNKVYFGKHDGTGAAAPQVLIDMTLEGDTPGGKTSEEIGLIDGSYILSKEVMAQTTDKDNRAWGSDGKLIRGTCKFNADVSEDTIEESYAVNGKTFHVGEGTPGASTGNVPDIRGLHGGDSGTGTSDTLIVKPFEIYQETPTWQVAGNIISKTVTEESPLPENHESIGQIANGVIGNGLGESSSLFTQILIDFNDGTSAVDGWLKYVSNTVNIFGKQGQLAHSYEEHVAEHSYLSSWTETPASGYDAMTKCTIPDTSIEYTGTEATGFGIYIGEFQA